MGKGMWIGGSDGVARKVKKLWIGGSDGLAHKVKKVWIGGSDNIARLAWSASGTIMTKLTSQTSSSLTLDVNYSICHVYNIDDTIYLDLRKYNTSTSSYIYCIGILNMDGDSIDSISEFSFTASDCTSTGTSYYSSLTKLNDTQLLYTNYTYSQTFLLDTTTMTATKMTVTLSKTGYSANRFIKLACIGDNKIFALVYHYNSSSDYTYSACIGSVTGTTLSFGDALTLNYSRFDEVVLLSDTRVILSYANSSSIPCYYSFVLLDLSSSSTPSILSSCFLSNQSYSSDGTLYAVDEEHLFFNCSSYTTLISVADDKIVEGTYYTSAYYGTRIGTSNSYVIGASAKTISSYDEESDTLSSTTLSSTSDGSTISYLSSSSTISYGDSSVLSFRCSTSTSFKVQKDTYSE